MAKCSPGLPDPKRERPALPDWYVYPLSALLFTAKGDLLTATGPAAPVILPVGADGQILIADSATPEGIRWGAIATGLTYLGLWNAQTNVPVITSGVGTIGDYYIVGTSGNTVIDGEGDWRVGDWIMFNGTVWQKLDNSSTPWVRNTRAIAGNGNQTIDDDVIEATAAGTFTLLAAPQTGLTITVNRNYAPPALPYTINGNGNTINGSATIALNFNGASATLHFTGIEWRIL